MNNFAGGQDAAATIISAYDALPILSLLFLLALYLLACIACYRISRRAGYPAMLSLLVFLPAINLVIIIMLGFMKWPIESQLEAYRKKHGPLEKKEKDFDNLPVCVKCQTPLPPGAKNCIACGWPDNYKGI